jgi:TolA-binding protein
MKRCLIPVLLAAAATGCATVPREGTLAELRNVQADVDEVHLEDSLDLAARSYRRYLEESPQNEMAPEAMRRLADLQIEKQFGIIGDGRLVEMEAPEMAAPETAVRPLWTASSSVAETIQTEKAVEPDAEFERRASGRQELAAVPPAIEPLPAGGPDHPELRGPRDAIETYKQILNRYPDYERNDQVLYQMSRAHDELGETESAVEVMERLIDEHPHSKYIDEVQFRRGEYSFVRRKFRDAEQAYSAIIDMRTASSYYELALYKMGWTLYKQEFYEEALHRYIAMLDYRLSIGYDFDQVDEDDDEHRVADTFRVVSLSFSNLGGPDVIDEYFSVRGHRSYADRIYSNLGEFYLDKLRYHDAASVYQSFIALNPVHQRSPHFGMRVVEIYEKGEFPQLVVDAKKDFATRYALDAEYWNYFDAADLPEVLGFLKTNLTDLANHYHARYQEEELAEERPASFDEASRWYREFLKSFPAEPESAPINYQLADLLLENGNLGEAAREYERTAYDYAPHERASAAGYAAVYAHRENLKEATAARQLELKQATVASSLRFADTFPEHEQAPVVLGAAADDLYAMQDFAAAIGAARKLIERYPNADRDLRRSAWVVVAHSSIDIADYQNAEDAYMQVLDLTPAEHESRAAIVDGLAASIYKQGEQANLLEDYRGAADHFLRIRELAPTSSIRTAAEYDASAALVKLEDWSGAAEVLENFREQFPEHELNPDATKQLAFIYHEDGQLDRSAAEYERIAGESDDPEVAADALLVAGDLYERAGSVDSALRVYMRYAGEFPRPLDVALETRSKVADIFKATNDQASYYRELDIIVSLDGAAGAERTDRSRYLAGKAALVLAEQLYQRFAELKLEQPFEESLAEKQQRMDVAMAALENLVTYEVPEVTAAATFYIAETFYEFSHALLESERPGNLTSAELAEYELVIEEEAWPFEERAIDVHEQNFELLTAGVFNPWVQQSLQRLVVLVPGRYAKGEISTGYMGSIDTYAYRMPVAPSIGVEGQDGPDVSQEAAPAADDAPIQASLTDGVTGSQ